MKLNLSANDDINVALSQLRRYDFAMIPDVNTDWIDYIPNVEGFSAAPVGGVYRSKLIGKNLCHLVVNQPSFGTSNATNFTISAPYMAANIPFTFWGNLWWLGVDNGSAVTSPGRVYIETNTNLIIVNKTFSGGSWTNANGKKVNFELMYEIAV